MGIGYMLIAIIPSMIGMMISGKLKSKFAKYSQMPNSSGMSGADVARDMLREYGITDVKIVQGKGMLTDHYNPLSKTVSLSPAVYQGRHVSAAAVAAHEVGHAVQHATAYHALKFRSAMVPLVKAASTSLQFLMLIAFMTINTMPQIMLITIIAFGMTTLFSLITLPVEFDASKRALVWLDNTGVARGAEYDGAKDALKWAAMTYVSAALSSLVMLVYLIFAYGSRR